MKLILLSLISLSLTSCFKTAEQIRREKVVDNMEQELKQSAKIIAELTTRVQTLQNGQMQATGKIEEINHLQETKSLEQQKTTENILNQINEQVQVLIENDKRNQKKISNLDKEVSSLRNYIKSVSGTLTKIAGPTKSSSQNKLQDAHRAFEKNKQDEAAKLYKECLVEGKINARQRNHVYYNLGLMDYWNKRYDSALVSFSKIYTKSPKSSWAPKALIYLARTFKKQKKQDEALATYSELIKKYPKTSEAKKAKKEMK